MNLAVVMNEFLYTPLMTLPQHTTIMTGAFFFPFVLSFPLITQESEGGSLRKQERHFFFVSRYGASLPVPSSGAWWGVFFFERNTRRGIRRDTRFFVIILIMFWTSIVIKLRRLLEIDYFTLSGADVYTHSAGNEISCVFGVKNTAKQALTWGMEFFLCFCCWVFKRFFHYQYKHWTISRIFNHLHETKDGLHKKPRGQRGHPASRDIGLISPILAYYKNKKDKMHYWCFTCLDKLTKPKAKRSEKIFPDPDNIHTVLVPPFVIL